MRTKTTERRREKLKCSVNPPQQALAGATAILILLMIFFFFALSLESPSILASSLGGPDFYCVVLMRHWVRILHKHFWKRNGLY
jgi:hypothetical protein